MLGLKGLESICRNGKRNADCMQKNKRKAEKKKAEAEKKKAAAEKKRVEAEKKRVAAEEVGAWQCTRRRNHDIAMSTGTRIAYRKMRERPKGRKLRLKRRRLRPKRLVLDSTLADDVLMIS